MAWRWAPPSFINATMSGSAVHVLPAAASVWLDRDRPGVGVEERPAEQLMPRTPEVGIELVELRKGIAALAIFKDAVEQRHLLKVAVAVELLSHVQKAGEHVTDLANPPEELVDRVIVAAVGAVGTRGVVPRQHLQPPPRWALEEWCSTALRTTLAARSRVRSSAARRQFYLATSCFDQSSGTSRHRSSSHVSISSVQIVGGMHGDAQQCAHPRHICTHHDAARPPRR